MEDGEEERSKYWTKSNLQFGRDYDFKFTNVNWYTPIEFCVIFHSNVASTAIINLDIDVVDDSHPLIMTHEQLTSNENQLDNVGKLMDQVIKAMNHYNDKERNMRDLNGILSV